MTILRLDTASHILLTILETRRCILSQNVRNLQVCHRIYHIKFEFFERSEFDPG